MNHTTAMRLPVHTPSKNYDIHIGEGLLAHPETYIMPHIRGKRCFIVTDNHVAKHYLTPLTNALEACDISIVPHIVTPGEVSKSFDTLQSLIDTLLQQRAERSDTIIALGGGVVGDLAGFAASIILRGISFIQIPTTLLSQVDSSVGGKTGINVPSGKNLVGAFYQPETVLIDINTLQTLPTRELKAGYAEIVKYGMIYDAPFFKRLEQIGSNILALDPEALTESIHRCCAIKAEIVTKDEKEQGVRALLNFGHTFGHAYEKACFNDGDLLHGEAVSFGMVMAAELSVKLKLCDTFVLTRLKHHLEKHGLPVSYGSYTHASPEDIITYMYSDKKVESGALRFILLQDLGAATIRKIDDIDAITSAILSCEAGASGHHAELRS